MLDNKDFENKAWGEMLGLLDQEMPEKKGFAWWKSALLLLLFVFIGGGLMWFESGKMDFSGNQSNVEPAAIIAQNSSDNIPAISGEELLTAENQIITKNANLDKIRKPSFNVIQDSHDFRKETSSKTVSEVQQLPLITNNTLQDKTTSSRINLTQAISRIVDVSIPVKIKSLKKDASLQSVESLSFASTFLDAMQTNVVSQDITIPSLESINEDRELALTLAARERVTNLYAYAGVNYNPAFRSLGSQVGLIGEIGAEHSPWSFSTGLVYELYGLQTIPLITDDNRAFQENVLEDETIIESAGIEKLEIVDASSLLNVSYLNVPLQFHYRFNRIRFGIGIENRFLVGKQARNGNLDVELSNYWANVPSGDLSYARINRYHMSVNQALTFRIAPKIDFGLDFQYDLTGIFTQRSFTASNINNPNRLDNIGLHLAYKFR